MIGTIGRKQLSRCGLGLAVAAFGAATVFAQGPGGGFDGGPGMGPHRPPMERAMGPRGERGHEFGRWWDNPRIAEKLKLTDTQRKAMDDIYQQHRLTLVDLHATLEKAELQMEPMISADTPDEGKILSQIDRVAQSRAELEKANARMLLDIRKQLTPDQWKQMKADRAAHREGPGGEGPGAKWHGHDGAGKNGPGGQGPGGQGSGGPGGQGQAAPGAGAPPAGPGDAGLGGGMGDEQ